MGLKETIENHPVAWLLGTLLAGFLAGLSAYKGILEIAQLEVVPKARIEELEKQAELVGVADVQEALPPEVGQNGPAQPKAPETEVRELRFSAKLPFPDEFSQVTPGMRLSEARRALPTGRLTTSGYLVDIFDLGLSQLLASDTPE